MEHGEELDAVARGRDDARDRPEGRRDSWPFALVICAVVAGALAACGTSPPVSYYTIEPSTPSTDRVASSYRGPALSMGSLRVPPTMDRLEMLRDVQAGRVEVRELDHWAAPLARSARLALAQDLAARLPAGTLRFGAEPSDSPAAAVVKVQVLSLKIDGGLASMSATWSVDASSTAAGEATTSIRGDSMLQAPAGSGALETARAWSALLGLLADDIVAKASASPR